MSSQSKHDPSLMLNVGILFGGRSPEHEVSIISALQAASALDTSKYNPVPLYVSKSGDWYTGDHLLDISEFKNIEEAIKKAELVVPFPENGSTISVRTKKKESVFRSSSQQSIDVVFIAIHGSEGENGSFQGFFETMNVPYTGSGVLGSSVGMDKVITKMVCMNQGIPVLDYLAFRRVDWEGNEDACVSRVETKFDYPIVVKPVSLGSSIGVTIVADRKELEQEIDGAFRYDERVLVERCVTEIREINCSILGSPREALASALEEPLVSEGKRLLSYAEKYERGGGKAGRGQKQRSINEQGMAAADRIIPAKIDDALRDRIKDMSLSIFRTFECSGVARLDFIIDAQSDELYFNEINTVPGSFAFYLWEVQGMSFTELTTRMIEAAISTHRIKNSKTRVFQTNLLDLASSNELTAAKLGGRRQQSTG